MGRLIGHPRPEDRRGRGSQTGPANRPARTAVVSRAPILPPAVPAEALDCTEGSHLDYTLAAILSLQTEFAPLRALMEHHKKAGGLFNRSRGHFSIISGNGEIGALCVNANGIFFAINVKMDTPHGVKTEFSDLDVSSMTRLRINPEGVKESVVALCSRLGVKVTA